MQEWSPPVHIKTSAPLPVLPTPNDIEPRLKKALDDLARSIGRSAVNHLKEMYPDALAAVTRNAETSLTNHVRNNINHHMKPVLDLLIELKTNRTI